MYDISLILRRNAQKKNGEFPVNIRLKVDSLHAKIYATNVAVLDANWDEKRMIVKKSDPLFFTKNETLKEQYSRAEKILLLLNVDNLVSIENFEARYFQTKSTDPPIPEKTCFFQYANARNYLTHISKIQKFQSSIFIEDITSSFIAQYENYMRTKLGNVSNTVHKTMKFLKPVLGAAVRDEIIKRNPFEDYIVKKAPTNRDYLTLDELHRLEDLLETYRGNPKLHNVLTYFLFACYTGLRYGDLSELRHKNIVEGNHIELVMHKTHERVIIPLSAKAKSLLPEASNFLELKIFKVLSNQKTNDYLKSIAIAAGINKTVTCHVARHTFATVCLTLDIPIHVVSKLLGHTDIKHTQIYAKIIDKKKFDEMEKWNSL